MFSGLSLCGMAPNSRTRSIQEPLISTGFDLREKRRVIHRQSSRRYFYPILTVLLCALAWAGVLAAQEPPKKNTTQDSGIVLQQTVRRVRVDVVVTDAQGHAVKGLQASDFRVAEDGKPQSIRQFGWYGDENAEVTLSKRPPLPPHTFMNLPGAPVRGPLTVLLYDVLNTPLDDQPYARAQMLEFIKKSTGRRIAAFVLGDRLRLLQGFTSDTELMERAISDSATKPQRPHVSYSPPSGADDMAKLKDGTGADKTLNEMAEKLKEMEETEASERMDRRVDMTLDALKQIGRFLAGIPGRKNLIWYSGSFPAGILPNLGPGSIHPFDRVRNYADRIKAATNVLNSAEVSVYPVDARGLLTDIAFQRKALEFATMDAIGEQTGGRAFYNTNGLERALASAADDGNSYYSLVYAPTNMKFDGSVRRISVHLKQGHYHLAYRRSYYATELASGANQQAEADDGKGEAMAVASQFGAPLSHQLIFAAHVDVIGTPAPATEVQMAALAPYQEQAAKAEHRKFAPPKAPVSMQRYAIEYAVLASQLALPLANGVYRPRLSVAALAFNADGETLYGTKARIEDAIPASNIDNIRKNGYLAAHTLLVPVDTAVIRLVVHDDRSGRVGSMEIRLPLLPDEQQPARPQ